MIFFKKSFDPADGVRVLKQRKIADVHTHILPGIDDGSRSVEESIEMLAKLAAQGVGKVVLTPHYYPAEQAPESFFEKRAASAELLNNILSDELPEVVLGAEVLYFRGISRIDVLNSLCAQGTRTLLLEMPTDSWSEYMLSEIAEIQASGTDVVLAHIERYFSLQSESFFEKLENSGVKYQINANSLMSKKLQNRLLRMLKNGEIHFIGSDCHDTAQRAPNMDSAFALIEKYAGEQCIDMLERNSIKYFK